MKYRPGDVVVIPKGFFGEWGLVETVSDKVVSVTTGSVVLAYAPQDLSHVGRIELGRTYGNTSGRRFRRCTFRRSTGDTTLDVCVREPGGLGEVTAVTQVRILAFRELLARASARAKATA